MEQNTSGNLFDLQVDQPTSAFLGEAAKWAKFLAIVGFIFCGLMVLTGLFAGSIMSAFMSSAGVEGGAVSLVFFAIMFMGAALIYFFPCLFLFNFATKMQLAIRNNDQQQLINSSKNLKSLFKFLGILTVIFLVLWILGIIANLGATHSGR